MQKSLICLCTAALCSSLQAQESQLRKPNVLLIYVDDLGYGDLSCYGAVGVRTPNIDRLANEGIRFTDAHCSAATCTPSRYSLLTGSYAFRNNAAILPGDAPLLIDTDKGTLPKMFKESGYTTGIVGKWHLGLGDDKLNWNGVIKPGPSEVGFDYSYIMPATGDRVPCVFVENQRIIGLDLADPVEVSYQHQVGSDPTGKEHPELTHQTLQTDETTEKKSQSYSTATETQKPLTFDMPVDSFETILKKNIHEKLPEKK
ncbi:MAG: sulfatase-like hydrolase/transferase [Prolixibacteraceae bacterium]|jgi:hypothetical protein|nr:sulfatase-like hydrolase/transferase [Prolixibacteraceae bacterium]